MVVATSHTNPLFLAIAWNIVTSSGLKTVCSILPEAIRILLSALLATIMTVGAKSSAECFFWIRDR